MGAIFYASSLSDVQIPADMPDVAAHSLAYMGLGALLTRALAGGFPAIVSGRVAAAAIVLTAAYGVTDEVHQMFVPGRTAEIRDLYADAIGGSAGTGLCWACGILSLRLRQRPSP
jgi:VanZ family protein